MHYLFFSEKFAIKALLIFSFFKNINLPPLGVAIPYRYPRFLKYQNISIYLDNTVKLAEQ